MILESTYLKSIFDYLPDGSLVNRVSRTNSAAGQKVGWLNRLGYRMVMVRGVTHPISRIVWAWHGNIAVKYIDHINTNRDDNRIENLRPATKNQNMQNRGTPANSTTGVKNISYRFGKWLVKISANKVTYHIGYFDDFELAEIVAISAREKYHGEFAKHI